MEIYHRVIFQIHKAHIYRNLPSNMTKMEPQGLYNNSLWQHHKVAQADNINLSFSLVGAQAIQEGKR